MRLIPSPTTLTTLTVTGGNLTVSAGNLLVTPANQNVTPGITAGTTFNVATSTITDTNTAMAGTATAFAANAFFAPTLAATNTGVTTTDAATLYINAAPVAGTNETITNAWALWLDSGGLRCDGTLSFAGQSSPLILCGATDLAFRNNVNSQTLLDLSNSGQLSLTPLARNGTPSTTTGAYFTITTATFTDNATAMSGTATAFAANVLTAPTLAASNTSVTTTDAATLYIDQGVIAGTNETLTNSWALWVDSGNVTFDKVFGYGRDGAAAVADGNNATAVISSGVHRSNPAGAITGFIIPNGTFLGQKVTIINVATGANTITMAAAATSHVADGTSCVIAGLNAMEFVWDPTSARWYKFKA